MLIRSFTLIISLALLLPGVASRNDSTRANSVIARGQNVTPEVTTTTCNDGSLSIPCFLVLETGAGNAIKAAARHNTAVYAITRSTRNVGSPLTFGFTMGLDSGVVGSDLSSRKDDINNGVLGISQNATGVAGTTFATGPLGNFGVFGADANPSTKSGNVGVEGISNHVGVGGLTAAGAGVSGFAQTTGTGVTGASNNGFGVIGFSLNGTGVEAASFSRPALIASSVFGDLFQGFTNIAGTPKEVASLDNAGNLILAGNLTTGGTPQAITRTASGRNVIAYMAKQAVPTIEDVGESQLRLGVAHVRIDPVFSQAMDVSRRYVVFITPNGDCNTLYVTQRLASSFEVREARSGQSNAPFSYRIVAAPYGITASRLPAARIMTGQLPLAPSAIGKNLKLPIQR